MELFKSLDKIREWSMLKQYTRMLNDNLNITVSNIDIKRIIAYKNLSNNAIFKKRGSGASSFVAISSLFKAITEKDVNVLILSRTPEYISDLFKTGNYVYKISKNTIYLNNGSKIMIKCQKSNGDRGVSFEQAYIDDYIPSLEVEKYLKEINVQTMKMHRRNS